MPTKRGTLSPQEQRFSHAYAATGNAVYAGEKAGYSQPDAHSYKVLQRPAIQVEIVRIQQERMTNELLPLAVDCLHRLITNVRTPAGAAFNAAKYVIDRGLGFTDGDKGREPHEMTGDELSRQIDRLRHEAAKRSGQIIDVTPLPSGVFD